MKFFALITLLLVGQTLFSQSGVVWTQTKQVASSQFGNMHPRVVTDGAGEPMIIWGNGDAKQVYFSRRSGASFTTPLLLNPASIPVFAASWAGPDLAAHGDTVYVVYKETPEDASGIYVVHSFDGGLNFSDPERVDAIADSISRFPAIAADANGNPLVAFMKFNPGWGNSRYVLAKSSDYGVTFDKDVMGSGFSGGTACDCCPATVTTSGNTVALLYRDNLNNLRTNWAGISSDGGFSFSNGMEVDDTNWMVNACPASSPDGVIIGDHLYSVFMSAAVGKTLCYRSRSSISNLQMETTEPLTGTISGLNLQNYPRIAAAGNAAAIVWQQTVNGAAQLAVQFTNNLASGFPSGYDVLVANNVTNADVAFSTGQKIYVVWEDAGSGTVNFKSGTYTLSGAHELSTPDQSVQIYPNPTQQSRLHLQFETSNQSSVAYEILSAQGQKLHSGRGQAVDGGMDANIPNLPQGLYFIRITQNEQIIVRQLILE